MEKGSAFEDTLAAGRRALDAGDWGAARGHFEMAVAELRCGSALEGLGSAYFWLDHPDTIDVRERAYRAYRSEGNLAGAARVAVALAIGHITFLGEEAVARGWLELAARSVADLDVAPEHGLLALFEADFALSANDPVEAGRRAHRAVEIGRAVEQRRCRSGRAPPVGGGLARSGRAVRRGAYPYGDGAGVPGAGG
jgi:hypothetical protein